MATTIIAAYAAVLATGGLAWEIYKWHRTHQTKVRVQLRNAFLGFDARRVSSVTAMNDNEHAIRTTSWGLETNAGSGQDFVIFRPLAESTLPGAIGAHDSASGFSDYDELDAAAELDFKKPVVAFVNLATGERIRSEPQTLAA